MSKVILVTGNESLVRLRNVVNYWVIDTGANTGIGYELVRLMAQKGHKVYLGARKPVAGREAAEKLRKENLDVTFVLLDVTKIETVKAAKETIEKNEGRLDVLVNNAGVRGKTWEDFAVKADVSAMRDCIEVNLIGLVQTTVTFLPLLRASPQAVILNVSSELASNSLKGGYTSHLQLQDVGYSASKAAVNSYTITLAQELEEEGIKVNAVSPGFTKSRMSDFHEEGKPTRQGAESLLSWALLGKDGATGKFVDGKGVVLAW